MAEIVQKLAKQELAKGLPAKLAQETEVKGGRVNYYLVHVDHPQREDQEPYQAECEDIIEALELNPDEANIFKEIWRGANARKHNGKPGHTALYGAQKIVHYAGRILRRISRTS
jgi:tRNA(Ile)-lysidine synthase TilS/MesJ